MKANKNFKCMETLLLCVVIVVVAVLVVVGGGGVAMMKRWLKNGKAKKKPHPPIIQKLGMAIDMKPANTPPPYYKLYAYDFLFRNPVLRI